MNLNQLLGTTYPIIQGGMANIATGEFAAAVSNAGGLGLIGGGNKTKDELREEVRKCKSLTDKPFGLNIMLLSPNADVVAELVVEEKIPVVTTGAGSPGKYIEDWKKAGAKVFPVVSSAAMAIKMSREGVDGVIAEGTEAGGHIGEMTTMALVPEVVAAVDLPVIAAGGIANGAQVLAAEALGACGVQVGTCLLVADECPVHEKYKDMIIKSNSNKVTVIGRIGGVATRVLKNTMTKDYIQKEKEGWDMVELEKFTMGALGRAVFQGDMKTGSIMAGQVTGQIKKKAPLKEILEGLMTGYQEEKDKLCKN